MKVVKTLVCPDGVTGLNGWQYLLDNNNNQMEFKNRDSVNKFLIKNGYSQQWIDEWIEIEETE